MSVIEIDRRSICDKPFLDEKRLSLLCFRVNEEHVVLIVNHDAIGRLTANPEVMEPVERNEVVEMVEKEVDLDTRLPSVAVISPRLLKRSKCFLNDNGDEKWPGI